MFNKIIKKWRISRTRHPLLDENKIDCDELTTNSEVLQKIFIYVFAMIILILGVTFKVSAAAAPTAANTPSLLEKLTTGLNDLLPGRGGSSFAHSQDPPRKPDTGAPAVCDMDFNIIGAGPAGFKTFNPVRCLSYYMLTGSAKVLGLSGVAFDYVMQYTVAEMSDHIKKLGSINDAWTAFRDLTNMFFIFALIYIAVMTIIGKMGSKLQGLIVNIIIAALLINFSLLFSKIIIDASNIVTLQFYNALGLNNTSLSGALTGQLKIATIYDKNMFSGSLQSETSTTNIFLIALFGSIFTLVAAVVFFVALVLFIVRYVMLIFLMATSPVWFLGDIIPSETAKKMSNKWLNSITDQALFAPIFMMLLWFSFSIIHNSIIGGSFIEAIKCTGKNCASAGQAITAYIISIVFLIISIVAAKQTGAVGGDWAEATVKKATRAIATAPARLAVKASAGTAAYGGRMIGGRIGKLYGEKLTEEGSWARRAQTQAGISGVFARAAAKVAKTAADTAAKGSFDVRGIKLVGDLVGKDKTGILGQIVNRPKGADGKLAGEGGYTETIRRESAKMFETAKEYGLSDEETKKHIEIESKSMILGRITGSRAAANRIISVNEKIATKEKEREETQAKKTTLTEELETIKEETKSEKNKLNAELKTMKEANKSAESFANKELEKIKEDIKKIPAADKVAGNVAFEALMKKQADKVKEIETLMDTNLNMETKKEKEIGDIIADRLKRRAAKELEISKKEEEIRETKEEISKIKNQNKGIKQVDTKDKGDKKEG